MLIYKIFRRPEWDAFEAEGWTAGAPIDVTDGFIHFSTSEQAEETAAKHFAAEEGLVLLAVQSEGLSGLEWEPSRGGALFPHLYRVLKIDDVLWTKPLPLSDGIHDFSGLL